MELKNEVRLLLVGRTGTGKSSVGNSILKRDVFRRCVSSLSVTQECKRGETIKNGKKITVVDTPGLFHTTIKQDLVIKEISKCMDILTPGPHAFLYVFRISRHSTEEEQALVELKGIFGDDFCKYCIILFVTDDPVIVRSVEEFVNTLPYFYRELVDKCSWRVLINCVEAEYSENMFLQVRRFQKEISKQSPPYYSLEIFLKSKSILYKVFYKTANIIVGWFKQTKKVYVILYILTLIGGFYYLLCNSPMLAYQEKHGKFFNSSDVIENTCTIKERV